MSDIINRALQIVNDDIMPSPYSQPVTTRQFSRGGYADGGDPVSSALDIARDLPETSLPNLTPTTPPPTVPSAEGRVGQRTLSSMFQNIPEGAPWAARGEEEAKPTSMKALGDAFSKAIERHANLPYKDRVASTKAAVAKLAPYVGMRQDNTLVPLLGKNAKLMKSEKGVEGEKPIETDEGFGVETTGLALAPAFQMGKFNTCPNSASCKESCLGKTSGNYFKVGGGQDLSAFKGPRLNSLNKTIAMMQEPEAFAIRLFDEITRAKAESQFNGNHLGVRLNVLSDLHPKLFESIIKNHPDVDFYDYTKNNVDPIAPNHHLTYSSTGVSQNGVDNPNSNWVKMRERLDKGDNVAMAFSHKDHVPEEVHDEETGKIYKVIPGDSHDFRPMDKVPEGMDGVIVGLKNKNVASKNDTAHEKSKGFFVKYDPMLQKTDKGTLARDEDGNSIPTNKRVVIKKQTKHQTQFNNDGEKEG